MVIERNPAGTAMNAKRFGVQALACDTLAMIKQAKA
jgi:hypothetical protein